MASRMTGSVFLASMFGCGYFPFAPGTFGTLVAGVPLVMLGLLWPPLVPLLAVLLLAVGIPAATRAERDLRRHDSGVIVIDEAVGYLVAMSFLPLQPFYFIAGFFLFRLFDIIKPPPARQMEKLPGGLGVMMDDVAAGIYANVILQVVRVVLVN